MTLSAAEQLLIEMINRARLDPEAEAARFGIDLNDGLDPGTLDGTPRQVLAPNDLLNAAAEAHSDWMLATDTFSHTGVDGSSPGERIAAAGYTFAGRYASGENITWRGSTGPIDTDTLMEQHHHRDLFLSKGHRVNMLHDFYREIGVSQQEGAFTSNGKNYNAGMVTENFALSGASVFLTGVVYDDTDGDDFYSIGEGRGNVAVSAAGSSTRSAAEGGYAIKLSAAADVGVTLGGIALRVDLSGGNGKLDLVGADVVLTSVDTTLDSAAGSLRALGAGDIALTGHNGADLLIGNAGDNAIDGRGGLDAVQYDMARADATLTRGDDGTIEVRSGAGVDRLANIEQVIFNDETVSLEVLFPSVPQIAHSGELLIGGPGNDALYAGGFAAGYAPEISAQVFRLYQAALARTPDSAGHAGWTQMLFDGARSLENVASDFVASAEFQTTYGNLDTGAFVDLLYQNVLGRAADAGGRAGWVSRIDDDGMTRAQAVVGFSQSREFTNATDAAATGFTTMRTPATWSDDIFRLYQATLDRAPDRAGFDGWSDQLSNGTAFSAAVAGFVNSTEFRTVYGDLDDGAFVELLYQNVLGRDSDAAGRQGWLETLAQGGTRVDVVTAFVQSAEFKRDTEQSVHDWIAGQGVHDVIVGGAGDDVLAGGALTDAFVFDAAQDGHNTVLDLEAWDQLHFNDFGYANAADVRAHLVQSGADVMFDDQGVEVTFVRTSLDMISDDMILT
ncbi:DUF4214 domain-containing protein [Pseudosulfitobacter sp. DSM 107133]|uniref:DUF4214 domain-containing protein n=1 Tax=Pseudosulfitobacter sp. DSM 107133 TaxID=2883100 RepID=UPI000DF467E4|nr:DUF4214 domain-containing protein [Pseudosulfitobacter sp. DSM 107133]UOA29056.1 hypothetical protein DSM107133_03815 [Pseudosulfitobacter sp. DSM 107133]